MISYYYKLLNCIENVLNILIILILKLKYIFFENTAYLTVNKEDSISLLGNGPSLVDDFEVILQEKNRNSKIMVVNLAIFADFFDIVKPDFYILHDPAFFRSDVEKKFIDLQHRITNAFINDVNWKMSLILPPLAAQNKYFIEIKKNKNITIFYRKTFPIIGGTTNFNNFLFRNNLASPLAQNVLIGGLFEILQMGYKNITIFGADHSWHENYTLGKNNVLYTEDRHFYDSENIHFKPHIDEYGVPVRVHEEFFNLYRTFKIYDSLSLYAKSLSAKVVNRSSITWVDSFLRK